MTAPTPPAGRPHRDRMRAGEPYRADDPELVALRRRAAALCDALNAAEPDGRAAVVGELFAAVGAGVEITPPLRCDYGGNISVGERFYANFGCVILDCAAVTIGDRVLFGPGVQVYAATHPPDPAERAAGWESAKPVTVGDDVWVGGGAILLPGVTVGAGSVIGAGAVVTRDVPPGVVAAGNPCRVLRPVSGG